MQFALALLGIGLSSIGLSLVARDLSDADRLAQALFLGAMGSGLDLGSLAAAVETNDIGSIIWSAATLVVDGIGTILNSLNIWQYMAAIAEESANLIGGAVVDVAINIASVALTVGQLY